MEQLLDSYLIESEYEQVRAFNHTPNQFDYNRHIEMSLEKFRQKQSQIRIEKARAKEEEAQKSLGPQKHSKPAMPQIPGSMSDFIIEEIKKTVDRNKKWQP